MDRLWVLESGVGSLALVDERTGKWQAVANLPGFTRGMDFCGGIAFIGLSQVRVRPRCLAAFRSRNGHKNACAAFWAIDPRYRKHTGIRPICERSARDICCPSFARRVFSRGEHRRPGTHWELVPHTAVIAFDTELGPKLQYGLTLLFIFCASNRGFPGTPRPDCRLAGAAPWLLPLPVLLQRCIDQQEVLAGIGGLGTRGHPVQSRRRGYEARGSGMDPGPLPRPLLCLWLLGGPRPARPFPVDAIMGAVVWSRLDVVCSGSGRAGRACSQPLRLLRSASHGRPGGRGRWCTATLLCPLAAIGQTPWICSIWKMECPAWTARPPGKRDLYPPEYRSPISLVLFDGIDARRFVRPKNRPRWVWPGKRFRRAAK